MRLVIFASLCLVACSDLPAGVPNVCGNGAVETGEDCDGADGSGTCGDADSAHACRFVCDSAACPGGFSCGPDGECRRPLGSFQPAPGNPYTFGADQLAAGDVDGDGIFDLLGTSQAELIVRFGAGSADLAVESRQAIQQPTGAVAFADLDGDGRTDVIVPSELGLFSFLAEDRTLNPFAYASVAPGQIGDDPRIVVATIDGSAQLDPIFLVDSTVVLITDELMAYAFPSTSPAVCFDGSDPVSGPDLCPDATLRGPIAGKHVAHARTGLDLITNDGVDDTEEIALGIVGKDRVRVFSPIRLADGSFKPVVSDTVLLPLGHVVASDGELGFGDFNGDGCVDLMIPTSSSAGASISVAFGTRLGTCTGRLGNASEQVADSDPTRVPRAYVDLDGNGQTDVVFSSTIVLTLCGAPPCPTWVPNDSFASFPRAWNDVVVTDVNRDGIPDLAGIVDGRDDLDILIGAGFVANFVPIYNHVVVPSESALHHLDTGDFDGDFCPDVVVADASHVRVSYGAAGGLPGELVDMGDLGGVQAVTPAFLVTGASDFDGIEDLAVFDRRALPDGTLGTGLLPLIGSTTRRMLAPLPLDESAGSDAGNVPDIPVGVVVGNYEDSGSTDAPDVVVLALPAIGASGGTKIGVDPRLISVRGLGAGDLAVSKVEPLPVTGQFDVGDALYAHVAGTGDAFDSVAGVDVTDDPRRQHGDGPPHLLVATPPVGAGLASISTFSGDLASLRSHRIAVADIDRDGREDVVVEMVPIDDAGHAEIVVVLATDSGYDASKTQLVATDCHDAAALQSDGDDHLEIAAICGDSVTVFIDADGTGNWSAGGSFAVSQAHGLVAGDFDGDGIDDLAVVEGQDGAVSVFRQCTQEDASCVPQ